MDAPQLVLVVVGLTLLAGGTAGMMLLGDEGTPTLYTVAFSARTEDLPLTDGAWSSPGTDLAFRVTRLNVTKVEVTVTCTDPNPLGAADPATVTVSVAGPNGLSGEASGRCGSPVTVPVATGTVPASTAATGTTPEDAAQSIPPQTDAVGEWTVAIEETRVQDLPAGGAPSGTVAVTVTSYVAEATPAAVR